MGPGRSPRALQEVQATDIAPRTRTSLGAASLALLALVSVSACSGPTEPRAPHPNVLLVTVDGLVANLLRAYGNQGENAPAIDAFAAQAMVFEHAYAPSAASRPAVASLMTGLHPASHGCERSGDRLPESVETLAERVYAEGVLTAAILSDGAVAMATGVGQGFEHYDEEIASTNVESEDTSAEVLFPNVTERGVEWLHEHADLEDGWFLWLHYASPRPDVSWVDTDLDPVGVASAADEAVKALLAVLDSTGATESTLVFLLGVHGGRDAARLPWIVRGPALAHGRFERPVSTVDLTPTLLEVYALRPGSASEGRSLLGVLLGVDVDRGPVLARGETSWGVAHERWLYFVDNNNLWQRLFDLPNDRGRTRDLAGDFPDKAQKLEARLERLRSGDFEWPPLAE